MSFFRRKRESPYNPEEIRQAVSKEELPHPISQPVKQEYSPHYVKPVPVYVPQHDVGLPETAPLFVKVEKYKDIVDSVNEVKRFISGIKQLFLIMNELQGIQQDSVNMLRTNVQRLEKSIEWVDHSLLRPLGFEELPHGEMEAKQIEQSLAELQREIASLRKDLERIG